MRFGRLIAVSVHHSKNHKRFWECTCVCGNTVVVRQDQLTTSKTRSCGCLLQESRHINLESRHRKKPKAQSTYGITGHYRTWNPLKHENPRLYRIWQGMKSRCYYSKNKFYHCYGGRGITVCDEWRCSFNNFAMWALNNGYNDHLSIDRIDVNGNYSPQNCRWITMREQQKNKRKSPSPEQ